MKNLFFILLFLNFLHAKKPLTPEQLKNRHYVEVKSLNNNCCACSKNIAHQHPMYPYGIKGLIRDVRQVIYNSSELNFEKQGTISVSFLIDKEGRTQDIQMIQKLHPDLNRIIHRAVGSLKRFHPAHKNDQAINMRIYQNYHFSNKKPEPNAHNPVNLDNCEDFFGI
jgi:outer membrane biosynthesis protein TonB